jgi:hypothetical protein
LRQALLAERTARWTNNIHSCGYTDYDGGECTWCDRNEGHHKASKESWSGTREEVAREYPLAIGLLLDLDAGTLAVYRGASALGIMKTGLACEYCWFATTSTVGETVNIERAGVLGEKPTSGPKEKFTMACRQDGPPARRRLL